MDEGFKGSVTFGGENLKAEQREGKGTGKAEMARVQNPSCPRQGMSQGRAAQDLGQAIRQDACSPSLCIPSGWGSSVEMGSCRWCSKQCRHCGILRRCSGHDTEERFCEDKLESRAHQEMTERRQKGRTKTVTMGTKGVEWTNLRF